MNEHTRQIEAERNLEALRKAAQALFETDCERDMFQFILEHDLIGEDQVEVDTDRMNGCSIIWNKEIQKHRDTYENRMFADSVNQRRAAQGRSLISIPLWSDEQLRWAEKTFVAYTHCFDAARKMYDKINNDTNCYEKTSSDALKEKLKTHQENEAILLRTIEAKLTADVTTNALAELRQQDDSAELDEEEIESLLTSVVYASMDAYEQDSNQRDGGCYPLSIYPPRAEYRGLSSTDYLKLILDAPREYENLVSSGISKLGVSG